MKTLRFLVSLVLQVVIVTLALTWIIDLSRDSRPVLNFQQENSYEKTEEAETAL